jgi:hypothetical protein
MSVFEGSSNKKVRGLQIITEESVEFVNELGVKFSSPESHLLRRCDDNTTARMAMDGVLTLFSSRWTLNWIGDGDGGSFLRKRTFV